MREQEDFTRVARGYAGVGGQDLPQSDNEVTSESNFGTTEMAMSDDIEKRCGGTGMVAYWDGSAYAGEMCRGCIDCERHDSECESELTSHGYTPCRCDERAHGGTSATEVAGIS